MMNLNHNCVAVKKSITFVIGHMEGETLSCKLEGVMKGSFEKQSFFFSIRLGEFSYVHESVKNLLEGLPGTGSHCKGPS